MNLLVAGKHKEDKRSTQPPPPPPCEQLFVKDLPRMVEVAWQVAREVP